MSQSQELKPELLDQVFRCIQVFQNRGQIVALDSIAVYMEREHGIKDRRLIEAATDELLAQERITAAPLYWQHQK
jgi:hypothetical protein